MKKKFLMKAVGLMALVLALGATTATTPFFAYELEDSVGSDANNPTKGEDKSQGQKTDYQSSTVQNTNFESNTNVWVYATKSSWATVSIPKTLVLGPSDDERSTYECTFDVEIQGDIAGAQSITVIPTIESILTEQNGKVNKPQASITINGADKITIGANDIANGQVYRAIGNIKATNVVAGNWLTAVNFGVLIEYDETANDNNRA